MLFLLAGDYGYVDYKTLTRSSLIPVSQMEEWARCFLL